MTMTSHPKSRRVLEGKRNQEGILLCNAMHITASSSSTTTRAVSTAIMSVGWSGSRRTSRSHSTFTTRTGEDNGDAHFKREVMGREVVVAVTGGCSTSARGSRSSTASSTWGGESALWSRSLASETSGPLASLLSGDEAKIPMPKRGTRTPTEFPRHRAPTLMQSQSSRIISSILPSPIFPGASDWACTSGKRRPRHKPPRSCRPSQSPSRSFSLSSG